MENHRKVIALLLCFVILFFLVSCMTRKPISIEKNNSSGLSIGISEQEVNKQISTQEQITVIPDTTKSISPRDVPTRISLINAPSSESKTSETLSTSEANTIITSAALIPEASANDGSKEVPVTIPVLDVQTSDSSYFQGSEVSSDGALAQSILFEAKVNTNSVIDTHGEINLNSLTGNTSENEKKHEEKAVTSQNVVDTHGDIKLDSSIVNTSENGKEHEEKAIASQNVVVPDNPVETRQSSQKEEVTFVRKQQGTGIKEENVSVTQAQVPLPRASMIQDEDTVSSAIVKPKRGIWPLMIIVVAVVVTIVMFVILKKSKKGRRIPVMDLIDDSPIEAPKRLISVSCPYEDEGDQSPLHVLMTLELSSCSLSGNVAFVEVPESGFPCLEKLESSKNEMETVFSLSKFFRKMENEIVDVYIKNQLNSRFHSIKWNFDVYSAEQDVPKIKLAFMLKSLSTGYELFYSSYQSIVGKIDDCDFSRLSFKGKRQ